ncbi:MAG: hypothetical protein CFE33_15175 [Pseudorhodobacter sp. PARRP1]|nr:MAG: hypothetical protein CFE33_15175 [Pseudorhodobacter sp. PARRP1]
MLVVDRAAKGAVLGEAEGHIDGVPLRVTLTVGEVHISWTDRKGPTFVIELNQLVKAAVEEIETLIGQRKALPK